MIETLLIVLAIIGSFLAAAWLYCAVYDFVDEWQAKEEAKRFAARDAPPNIRPLEERIYRRRGWRGPDGGPLRPPKGPPTGWERSGAQSKASRAHE